MSAGSQARAEHTPRGVLSLSVSYLIPCSQIEITKHGLEVSAEMVEHTPEILGRPEASGERFMGRKHTGPKQFRMDFIMQSIHWLDFTQALAQRNMYR